DENSEIGGIFGTSCYNIPEVLLEIGANPPEEPFIDRSRVSITFDEAARFGISYSKDDRQKRSRELGYREKVAKYYPHVAASNKEIDAHHFGYGKREEDCVFWWSLSAYFPKQVIGDSIELATRFGLMKTKAFEALDKLFGSSAAPVDNALLA